MFGQVIVALSDVPPQALKASYETMLAAQPTETELEVALKAATDAAHQAEWDFHNSVLAMKEALRARFGPDSNATQSVGYKKKSEDQLPRHAPKQRRCGPLSN